MKNWSVEEETGNSICPANDDYLDACKVADYLHIPLDTVFTSVCDNLQYDFEKEYWTDVFEVCLASYADVGNS